MNRPATAPPIEPAEPRLPALGSVFRAQLFRVAGTRRRGPALILALVVLQVVVMAGWGIVFGISVSTTPGGRQVAVTRLAELDGRLDVALDPGLVAVGIAGAAALAWALFWPFRVWRHETPKRRDYHWSLPVARRLHDGLRLLAGGACLAGVSAFLVVAAAIAVACAGEAAVLSRPTLWFWLDLLLAPLLVYGLVSILFLRTENPAGWLWGGGWGLAMALSILGSLLPTAIGAPVRAVVAGRYGLLTTLVGPLWREVGSVQATGPDLLVGWLLWGSLAVAGLWLAASTRSKRL